MFCRECKESCYDKSDDGITPSNCLIQKYLNTAYADLLVGAPPAPEVTRAILAAPIKQNSLIHYPYARGRLKAAALCLLKLKITSFRMFHSHLLIDVFVSKVEEEVSLQAMHGSFYLMLHGFITTPNKRLLDLICEFLEYRYTEKIPHLLFTVKPPEPELVQFYEGHGMPLITIGPGREGTVL